MYERFNEFGLLEALAAHRGVAIGYSAGAVIQLAEYHLSPDDDYPDFGYYRGIPYLDRFYLEVHYESTESQNLSIQRVRTEKHKPVFATARDSGAIIVDDGRIRTLGDVRIFLP